MRVELDGGGVIDLGAAETSLTIGIADFSRRVTDDFGVTTVVERGFRRNYSVRLMLPPGSVDEVQRQLANLRATPAQWIASDDIASLSVRGFYKDFSLDLATTDLSYCTLTVEGLTDTEAFVDPGGDPAADGQASTLQLLQPRLVTDATLTASSVAENDYPTWGPGVIYAAGARVTLAHRVYESLVAGNIGNAPATTADKWLDTGPTNRWAMFDETLGTVTTGTSQIVVTLTPAAATNGLAILDTDAGVIRVQAPGYDRTQLRGGDHANRTAVLFLDLVVAAGAAITVTIGATGGAATPQTWDDAAVWVDATTWLDAGIAPGPGPLSVGTLLIGDVVALGVSEASPTASITDYSRKDFDDFGEATIVERAWAKRMTTRALIRTNAVDAVAGRIAAVRARPSLWIGAAEFDSLTIYGFFKDFTIEVGPTVSTLSLSIEGLSKAAPIVLPTSDVGSTIFYQDDEPTTARRGDLWITTPDNPEPANRGIVYRFFGTLTEIGLTFGGEGLALGDDELFLGTSGGWILTSLSARVALASGNAMFLTSAGDPVPVAGKVNDSWYDRSSGVLRVWDGSAWVGTADNTALNQHLLPQVAGFAVTLDYQGIAAGGQLPQARALRRYLGSTDVSSAAGFALIEVGSATAAINDSAGSIDRGTLTLLDAPGDATLRVRSSYAGVDLFMDVGVAVTRAAPPSGGGGGGSGAPGAAATSSGPFTPPEVSETFILAAQLPAVTVGSSGAVALATSLQFEQAISAGALGDEGTEDQSTLLQMKWQRSVGGGGWTDVSSFSATSPAWKYFRKEPPKGVHSTTGSCQGAITDSGLLSESVVAYRLMTVADPASLGARGLAGTISATPQ